MKRSNSLKKHILLLFLIGGFTQLSSGQFSIEFMGGITESKLHIDAHENIELGEHNFTQNIFLGTGITYELKNNFKLSGELQYNQKGYKRPFEEQNQSLKWKAHSIDFFPGVHYKPIPYIEIGVGLAMGYAISEKRKVTPITSGTPLRPGEGDWGEPPLGITNYKDLDLGLYGLIGTRYQNLMLFLRYAHGLKSVDNFNVTNGDGETIGLGKLFNRQLQIGLNYAFPIKNTSKTE